MNITAGKYRMRDGGVAIVLDVVDTTYSSAVGYIVGHVSGVSYPITRSWETNGRIYSTMIDDNDLMEKI